MSLESKVHNMGNILNEHGISHKEVFVPDFTTPNPEAMERAVNYIDSVVSSGGKIYIHCLGGVGRSPLVLLTYFARSGMDVVDALKLITNKRKVDFTKEQKGYIYYLAQAQNPKLYRSNAEKFYLEEELENIFMANEYNDHWDYY